MADWQGYLLEPLTGMAELHRVCAMRRPARTGEYLVPDHYERDLVTQCNGPDGTAPCRGAGDLPEGGGVGHVDEDAGVAIRCGCVSH